MRISSGSARGRVINSPKGVDLRPTEERVRQALFNILGPALANADFLDVFSGSGAVGLEAISRGAGKTVFIDQESRCLKNAETHAKAFGFPESACEFLRGDAEGCLNSLARAGKSFDFVYLDPPYESEAGLQVLRLLGGLALLKTLPHARVIYEHGRATQAPPGEGSLTLTRQYPYGNSSLSFYEIQHAD